ncbi:core-binding factor subunit beta isoform X1 [Hydra vulgaris]|uniref:core-binding factor subunit beta isoform X1 n=1 Tax=Hydra vulgaris TaxID=6087 RepID=UPI001F5FA87C|nr:core-binding factor subunit beta isoform X1 [Hydra vulgaris]
MNGCYLVFFQSWFVFLSFGLELLFWFILENLVSYTGYRDRGHEERVARFQTECREGRCGLAFLSSGTSLLLYLGPQSKEKKNTVPSKEFLDFEKEVGKVYLKSRFIMNGVAVIFKGFIDLKKLDGIGVLEFDEQQAKIEDRILRDTIDQSRMRLQEFEERQQRIKQEPIDTEILHKKELVYW